MIFAIVDMLIFFTSKEICWKRKDFSSFNTVIHFFIQQMEANAQSK